MTPAEFSARLPKIANAMYWFADYTGCNVRTVKRWVTGELDVPAWVPRFLALHERLTEALAWSEEHGDVTGREMVWRAETRETLWDKDNAMLAARASQRAARRAGIES